MPRPTVFAGWWGMLLTERASGRIDLLAKLCGVSTRTLHRWYTREIRIPDRDRRIALRTLAGKELLRHPECPRFLRLKKKVTHA